jgi:hypothetical protein
MAARSDPRLFRFPDRAAPNGQESSSRSTLVAIPLEGLERLLYAARRADPHLAVVATPLMAIDLATPDATAKRAHGTVSLARNIYRFRRRRERTFGKDLFADPAWDLLLDLFIAGREGREISVSSACIAANAPATTALRWICQLEREGLISRALDPGDGRRSHLHLTDTCFGKMEILLHDTVPLLELDD